MNRDRSDSALLPRVTRNQRASSGGHPTVSSMLQVQCVSADHPGLEAELQAELQTTAARVRDLQSARFQAAFSGQTLLLVTLLVSVPPDPEGRSSSTVDLVRRLESVADDLVIIEVKECSATR